MRIFIRSEKLTAILHRAYDNIVVEMQELKAKRKGTCLKLDKQIANASKKKKMRALSELNLFDSASVVQPNSSQYHGHYIYNSISKEPAMLIIRHIAVTI
ncbi:hypothetical protein Ahy_A09g042164 [Arachis hypogaea]|uniref:Uncharacterized protein n=1 Tax=Arachis hypogaea TaxID=3818 RepID=A0A445BEY9_ARAHY|nr:hypothetical protein Ahy_A09g042164 [Arachis hypogaea]